MARLLLHEEIDLLRCAVLAQERARLVREQGVHEHVLLALREVADLFFNLSVGGGDQRTGRHVGRQHFGVAHDLRHNVLVHAARSLAVVAADVVLHLLGHDAPALAGEHVEHSLRAHDLRQRRDERRIAHLGTHLRNLAHHLGQAIGGVLDLKLRHEVRHHAARHLVRVHLHVRERRDAALVVSALAHVFPVFGDLEQEVEVEAGVVAALLERSHDHLDGRMRVAERQRRMSRVGDGGSGFGGFEDVGGRHAADVMAVDVQRQTDFGVERLHHALGAVGREHARHVLDADGVGTEVLELLAVVEEAVQRVHRRHRVGDGAFEVTAAFLDGFGVVDDVADVVERVEHAEDMHAIALRGLDEVIADVTRIMLVPHEVLAARQHGKRRVRRLRLDGSQPLPRVLVEETHARVERRTAPRLDGPVPDTVHFRQDRQHVADLHTRGPEALLAVTDGGIHDLKPWHELTPPSVCS